MKIYYTFGTDSRFPHRGGWVEVEADSVQQAHAIFRAKYPDRTPGILNCSDYYTEETFKKSTMSRSGNLGAFCHEVLALKTVYGYVNGEAVYSRDEFVFKARGRGPIEDDEELIAFAEKVTGGWYNAGWRRTFTGYYLGDYALDEPRKSLTAREYARLRELQKQARAAEEAADEAREWKLKGRYCYADNSVEDIYVDKDGVEKRVTVVAPHGDAC